MSQHAEQDVVRRAIEYLDRGEDQEALALLGPYVLRRPDDVEALFRIGVAFARTHRLADAVRIFGRVLEADPTHGRALWNLGRAQLVLDDPATAEPLLRLALKHTGDEAEVWADLAVALRSLGRARDARDLLRDACARFPEDVYMKARLLAVEIQDGAEEAARRTADRIETVHADDPVAAAAVLQFACDPPDADRARRAASRLWADQDGSILDYEDLLRDVGEAFVPGDDALLRSGEQTFVCPACGDRTVRREITGLVLREDALERLAAAGAYLAGNRCGCGLVLPRPLKLDVLYPSLSLALRVDVFPRDEPAIGEVSSVAPGTFGENGAGAPRAEVWFAADLAGPNALSLSLCAWNAARERERSLPEIGELGRAERRAREAVGALRILAGLDDGAEHEDASRPAAPEWVRLERERLLGSGIDCGPWPLSHVCRCGAPLGPFLFGSDRERRFEPEEIDEAAIGGRPFRDPETGETMLGFNCDACGRLHTWILGISGTAT